MHKLFFIFLFGGHLAAQTVAPFPEADFSALPEGNSIRFQPILPTLPAINAGGRQPFYTWCWEFGDGNFSMLEHPLHRYAKPGEYSAVLNATLHYDDGKMPKKKKHGIKEDSGTGQADMLADVFQNDRQSVCLKSNREPRAGEELTLIISYRNTGAFQTDGRLHLFFNERKFGNAHFLFQEARTHFGETPDMLLSQAEIPWDIDWALLAGGFSTAGSGVHPFGKAGPVAGNPTAESRRLYRNERVYWFSGLRPGEKRNLFVTLDATDKMLKDTTALIHLAGVFAPFDPAVPPDAFTLEIEIVSSHDPNSISVSDNKVNYRGLTGKSLDYRVRFQNNGEGPAKNIVLKVDIPEGLNAGRMQPIEWYPKCPVCPKTGTTGSCLDTAVTKEGLVFSFRNISLPGSRQKGVAYDSTKGFVRYRIVPAQGMPKRAFRSRASIVFDKNPPIQTNYSRTGFKTGLSLGIKGGYGFPPDSLSKGYVFFGLSLSPYKSWRIYPQLELLTGIRGQSAKTPQTTTDTINKVSDASLLTHFTLRQTIKSGNSGFVSFEIPFLLRKNFSNFLGVGLGGSARMLFFSGTDTLDVRGTPYMLIPGTAGYAPAGNPKEQVTINHYTSTQTRFSFFGDLTLGAVRAGPNLGIRAGGIADHGIRPFVQLSVEWKW